MFSVHVCKYNHKCTCDQICSVLSSGIVEGDIVLSLQQTMTEPKAVEKESQKMEDEASEVDMLKLFKPENLKCPMECSDLYEQLKEEPEALTLLAPAAGDTIISLDFNNSGGFLVDGYIFKFFNLQQTEVICFQLELAV